MSDENYIPEDGNKVVKTNEDVFRQGVAGIEFQGKVLEPYTAGRRMAADSMGLRFGKFTPEEAAKVDALAKIIQDSEENPEATKDIDMTPFLYQGVVFDVIVVLWLCTQPRSIAMKAMRSPDWAIEQAASWADKARIYWPSDTFIEAYKTFWILLSGDAQSTGKFQAQELPGGKKPERRIRSKNS